MQMDEAVLNSPQASLDIQRSVCVFQSGSKCSRVFREDEAIDMVVSDCATKILSNIDMRVLLQSLANTDFIHDDIG